MITKNGDEGPTTHRPNDSKPQPVQSTNKSEEVKSAPKTTDSVQQSQSKLANKPEKAKQVWVAKSNVKHDNQASENLSEKPAGSVKASKKEVYTNSEADDRGARFLNPNAGAFNPYATLEEPVDKKPTTAIVVSDVNA